MCSKQAWYQLCFFFLGASIYWSKEIKSKLIGFAMLLIGLYLAGFKELSVWYSWLNDFLYVGLPGGKIATYYFVPMLAGYFLVTVAVKSRVLNFVIENNVVVLLGRLSFSAYLIQIPLFYIFTPRIYSTIHKFTPDYDIASLCTIGLSILVVYLVSFVFNKFVDEKCIGFSKEFALFFLKKDRKYSSEKIFH